MVAIANSLIPQKGGEQQSDLSFHPLKEGDIIFFAPQSGSFYLHGDEVSDRVGFQSTKFTVKGTTFLKKTANIFAKEAVSDYEPENIQDCLWRVIPQLSYNELEQVEQMRKLNASEEEAFNDEDVKKMEQALVREQKNNHHLLKQVYSGQGKDVTYGQVIQLMHLKTGKFLTCENMAAVVDRDALKLSMKGGGSAFSWFKIRPRIKVRSEGGQIFVMDSIDIVSVKIKDMVITVSENPYDQFDPEPRIHEANLSLHSSSAPDALRVNSYARYTQVSYSQLRVGLPIRLYHHEAEAYMQASSSKKKFKPKSGEGRAHFPYLKRVKDAGDFEGLHSFSAKAVWVFEYMKRSKGGMILWDTVVRVRHVPSGKYLAVDYNGHPPIASADDGEEESKGDLDLGTGGLFYDPILVDDREMKSAATSIDFDQTLFILRKVEDKGGDEIDIGSNIRLEHNANTSKYPPAVRDSSLYLTWTEQPKQKVVGSKKTRSQGTSVLAFTSVRRNKDALQIVEMEEKEQHDMLRMLEMRGIAEQYVNRLNKTEIATGSQVQGEYHMLKELIFDIVIGNQTEKDEPETIVGTSNRFHQIVAKDIKLMDALMEIVQTPMDKGWELEFSEEIQEFKDPKFIPVAGVHRLATKALAHIFLDYPENEEYFARQTLRVKAVLTDEKGNKKEVIKNENWVNLLIKQVPFPKLGATDTLNLLLTNNIHLLNQYVNESTISFFQQLIKEQGPYKSFMAYFAGICSCRGQQILTNQESVLKGIVMNPKKRRELLIEHTFIISERPSTESRRSSRNNFLGKKEWEEGFQQVYVHWDSETNPKMMTPQSLGLEEQSIEDKNLSVQASPRTTPKKSRVITGFGKQEVKEPDCVNLVKIEDLMSILNDGEGGEADRLKKLEETGEKGAGLDTAKSQIAAHRRQLAEYLIAEVDMFGEMCLGRSSNAIRALRALFPYPMLMALLGNARLPALLRAAYAKLALRLWVDCFPHQPNCGRHQFPDLIWVFSRLQRRRVQDPEALPRFALSEGHPFRSSKDPFESFPDSNKFFAFQSLLREFFDKMELDGGMKVKDPHSNQLTLTVLNVVKHLASFGFYGEFEKIKELTEPMIGVLDGRKDKVDEEDNQKSQRPAPLSNAKSIEGEDETAGVLQDYDSKSEARYVLDENTELLMKCKESICQVLLDLHHTNSNFILGNVMEVFKGLDKKFMNLEKQKEKKRDKLIKEAEEKFVKSFQDDKSSEFDLQNLSGKPLDTILLDLLMYESDDLFHAALMLLKATHNKQGKMIEYLQNVKLVPELELPIFKDLPGLELKVGLLKHYLNSPETWAKGSSNFDIKVDSKVYEEVYQAMGQFISFLLLKENEVDDASTAVDTLDGKGIVAPSGAETKEAAACRRSVLDVHAYSYKDFKEQKVNSYNQELLLYLGLPQALLGALQLDYNPDEEAPRPPKKGEVVLNTTLRGVVNTSLTCLTLLVKQNPSIQAAVFGEFAALQRLMKRDPALPIPDLMTETLRGNASLCKKTEDSLYRDIAARLDLTGNPDLLEFYAVQIEPVPNEVIARTQNLTLRYLLDDKFYTKILDFDFKDAVNLRYTGNIKKRPLTWTKKTIEDMKKRAEYQTKLLRVLAECSKAENSVCTGKLQKYLESSKLIEALGSMVNANKKKKDEDILKENIDNITFRNLLGSMAGYLTAVFFDTSMQEPKHVQDKDLWKVLTAFTALAEISYSTNHGAEINTELQHCLAVYMLKLQNQTKLTTVSKQFHETTVSKPFHDKVEAFFKGILEDTSRPDQERHEARAVLDHAARRGLGRLREAAGLGGRAQGDAGGAAGRAGLPTVPARREAALPGRPRLLVPSPGAGGGQAGEKASLGQYSELKIQAPKLGGDDAARRKTKKLADDEEVENQIMGEGEVIEGEGEEEGEPEQKEELDTLNENASARLLLQKRFQVFVDKIANSETVKKSVSNEQMVLVHLLEHVEKLTDPEYEDSFLRDSPNPSWGRRISLSMSQAHRRASQAITKSSCCGSGRKGGGCLRGCFGCYRRQKAEVSDLPVHIAMLLSKDCKEDRTTKVTFNNIVRRMNTFVLNSLSNPDHESSIICVLELLEFHLRSSFEAIKAADKTEDVDEKLEATEKARKELKEKQISLKKLGVVEVVFQAVALDSDSAVSQVALRLGLLMVKGGNNQVQAEFVSYAEKHDDDGRFFRNMKERIEQSRHEIIHARRMQENNSQHYVFPARTFDEAQDVFRFMAELCEGHYLPMQNLLREQPINRKSYDLVQEVVEFVAAIAKSQITVSKLMIDREFEVLNAGLDYLIEVTQGPCPKNQEMIADSEAMEVCKVVMTISDYSRLKNKYFGFEAKARVMLLMGACLEGRQDMLVQSKMAKYLEPAVLDSSVQDLSNEIGTLNNQIMFEKFGTLLGHEDQKLGAEKTLDQLQKFIDFNIDYAALSLFDARSKLGMVPELKEALAPPKESDKKNEKEKFYKAYKTIEGRLGSIEIQWQGYVEVCLFPVPEEAESLTEQTQENFLRTCDLETQETRLKALMETKDKFLDEMRVLNSLAHSKVYKFIKRNYQGIKYLNFFLVVMLNLLLMLVSTGEDFISHSDYMDSGSYGVVLVLSWLVTAGYIALIGYFIVSNFRLSLRAFHRQEEEFKLKHADQVPPHFNFGMLKVWFVAVLGYVAICVVHGVGVFRGVVDDGELELTTAMPDNTVVEHSPLSFGDYLVTYCLFGAFVFIPTLLSIIRNSYIVTSDLSSRIFCTLYDVCLNEKVSFNLIFIVCIILGFLYKLYFFSFLLFDIISLSEELKNTLRAVFHPIRALAWTATLFAVVVFCFAMIGYSVFGNMGWCEDGCPENPAEQLTPNSATHAFWMMVHYGIRNGDISDLMEGGANHTQDDYYTRIFYAMGYFVIVGVLLFDMVTGIILDTFGSLRQGAAYRKNKLLNEAFISAITREMYDENGLNFEKLKSKDQDLWSYVYFMLYLEKKDPGEYNGAEKYVSQCIKANDFQWFPTRASNELQRCNKLALDDETPLDEKIEAMINSKLAGIPKQVVVAVLAALDQQKS